MRRARSTLLSILPLLFMIAGCRQSEPSPQQAVSGDSQPSVEAGQHGMPADSVAKLKELGYVGGGAPAGESMPVDPAAPAPARNEHLEKPAGYGAEREEKRQVIHQTRPPGFVDDARGALKDSSGLAGRDAAGVTGGILGGTVDGLGSLGSRGGAPAQFKGGPAPEASMNARSIGRPVTPPVAEPAPVADKNGWYRNTYQGGEGSRESLEKAIAEGVLVDGKRVKLEAFTSAFKQDFPYPTDGALAVSVRTDRTKAPKEGGSIFLEVGLQAMSREAGTRPPLNVVMVIDRSGSMGEEGKFEAVKAAATEVVGRLTPKDRLAIVTYSYGANVEVPLAPVKNKKALEAAIQAMVPKGGTNIYDGLNLGYQELRKAAGPMDGNLLLLFTDGQVTAGERNPRRFEALAKEASDHDIEVTTIGMGVTYNEELMMNVSRAGGGNYHFLKDAGDVGKVIRSELEDLTKAVARGVRMRVVLPHEVDLVRVLGSEQLSEAQAAAVKAQERQIDQKIYEELGIKKDRADQDEPGIKMLIPSFRANDSHVVVMELRIPPGMKVPPGSSSRPLAEVFVKYKDVPKRKNAELVKKASIDYASDRAASVASIVPAVKKNILGFQTGETLMAASRLLASRDVTGAVKRIDDQMVLLGVAAREWKDPDLERDATMLGRYKDLLIGFHRKGMNDELAAYLGKSFSYSAWQRLK